MSFDGKVTRMRKQKDAEVTGVHAKTFTAWINANLRKKGIRVNDMNKDLQDGIILLELGQVLTGKEFPMNKVHKNPTLEIHKLENVTMAVDFLRPYTGLEISSKDIVSGNTKVLLGLVWRLILNFQVMETVEDSGKGTAQERHREAKKKLVEWAKGKTAGYKGVNVEDIENSFQDGLAFCALIHKYNPHLLNYEALDPKNVKLNLETAFKIAEEELGIPQLLDADDMVQPDKASRPDEQCIMTYLSEFPRAFLAKMEEETGQSNLKEVVGSSYVEEDAAHSLKMSLKVEADHRQQELEQLRRQEEELKRREDELRRVEEEVRRKFVQDHQQAQQQHAQQIEDARRRQEEQEWRQREEQKRRQEQEDLRLAHELEAKQQDEQRRRQEDQRRESEFKNQQDQLRYQQMQQEQAYRDQMKRLQDEAEQRASTYNQQIQVLVQNTSTDRDKFESEIDRMRRENEELRKNLNNMRNKLTGRVKIVIMEARGIMATDIFTGKSDPYVTLTLERQKEKTKTIKRTLNPKWHAEYKFYVSDPNAELVVTLWDWQRFSKDDFLGHVVIHPNTLPEATEVTKWYPLLPKKPSQKVSGELQLSLTFTKDS